MSKSLVSIVGSVVIGLAAAIPWRGSYCVADDSTELRPNFLIILTDDQRHDTIRAAGCPDIHTPALDRLSREGTLFTQAMNMGSDRAAVCVPSRAMLLTGASLYRHKGRIPREVVTLPELLLQNGYETFATGKWHNDAHAASRSFESGKAVFLGGMASHFRTPIKDIHRGEFINDRIAPDFNAKVFADTVIDFLEGRRPDDRPFFAYLSFLTPHDPRVVPDRYHQMYDAAEMPLPPNFLPEHPFDNGGLRIRDEKLAGFPREPDEVRQHIADYYAAITATDTHVGRVLDALDELQLAENTIVIFSGDHGLAVGQHGLMGKQNLYEHSIRVPLIMRGPGIPSAMRSEAQCLLSDVYPTVAAMAGLPVPKTADGKDLGPVLRGELADVREATFHAYRDIHQAVRTPKTKLIEYAVDGHRTTQLFDLENDPWEMENLAEDAAHSNLLATMREELRRLADHYGAPALGSP